MFSRYEGLGSDRNYLRFVQSFLERNSTVMAVSDSSRSIIKIPNVLVFSDAPHVYSGGDTSGMSAALLANLSRVVRF